MLTLRRLAAVVVMSLCFGATTQPTVKPGDLPRVPPTEPRDAIKTMKVRPGFHAELAACEPNVVDPVAMCFDENGRMFVVEMRDYSERRNEKLGRIRMLEDLDGDGVFEKSAVFLDHLPWPTAVMWVNGGLLVGACPDILFAKDTNGDGVADETKTLFTGFGSTQEKLNVQGLFNNFIWGPDNRIHGCSGHDGGMVESKLHPTTQPLDVRNKGFVIDPRDWTMTTEAGGGQYGLSFDPSGRLFTCENSSHCELFMYDARYAARNPYVTLPDPLISIAADGPAAEVFRASPEEPWRVIRTRWRVAGLVGGPVEGGGRSAGYFTGATGLTIYKGDAFGPDYVGDAFVGDAGGNLVHHKHIHTGPDGIEPVAERPADEKKIEFLASTDNWFRPVDFANAPDGCLYVCDMYRETIEHPWSLPPQIKQYLDLNSGNDRGRIYRFAPDGYKLRPPPKLGGASTAELVALLEHPNGWHRETASRLLYERQDPAAVPLLRSLVLESHAPLAAMHALWALDGLGVLRAADVTAGVRSRDPGVRVQAVRLSEKFAREDKADADRDALWAAVAACAKDPDARVRYQLAFTLGEWDADERPAILARLLRSAPQSKWMRAAVLSSVGNDAGAVFDQLKADAAFGASAEARAFLEPLVRTIGQMPGGDGARRDVAAYASGTTDPVLKFTLARALAEAIASRHGSVDALADLGACIKSAAACAAGAKAPPAARAAAIPLLAYERYDDAGPVLRSVLANRSSPTAAAAALATLDHFDDPRVATDLLAAWPSLSPRLRTDVISTLLKRPARAAALLAAIEKTQVQPTDIDAAQANALRHHPDAQVRQAAERLLPPPPSRESVLAAFRAALDLSGDAARGRKIYESRCISCHRAAGEGNAVGPDFVTIKNSGREKLLLNILDPNREVAPQYVAFLIETRDGQSLLGILASDTPAALTVRQAYGRETVVPRANIKRMTSQGKSLMPEGLEEGLKPQDAADLMTFIEGVK